MMKFIANQTRCERITIGLILICQKTRLPPWYFSQKQRWSWSWSIQAVHQWFNLCVPQQCGRILRKSPNCGTEWKIRIATTPTNVNELWHFPRRFKNKPDKQRRRIAVESFEAQILYPKNNEQIDKMYAVHSLSFKVSHDLCLPRSCSKTCLNSVLSTHFWLS